MSHQRYPSLDPVKEPHSVSLKVLRLSRPSLVTQHTLPTPATWSSSSSGKTIPASLAYKSSSNTNPDPFLLTPILNLPPSFGSAYVGETFSCTLCANHDIPPDATPIGGGPGNTPSLTPGASQGQKKKYIRDVRIEAEMKTPASSVVQKLNLGPPPQSGTDGEESPDGSANAGTDLEVGGTLQRIVNFDLKEEGNHVLAVTVSYYEATETSGRTRTFRKLYQFICKGSLIVRTKIGALAPPAAPKVKGESDSKASDKKTEATEEREANSEEETKRSRRWVLEAQLENCSEDLMQLDRVGLDLEQGFRYHDVDWRVSGSAKPFMHPGEVEQVCFVIEEDIAAGEAPKEEKDGRVVFGVLGIGWRTEMGSRGYLSTGKLGARGAR
ncbi:hypothetical protein BX600DRAFT_506526 [Xylariales sp. PMI_506]|nr:hypothetical protein BX600DRAFT_506526 [Xylariales sp. PMI_506]